MPAADFTADQLLYLPRNLRAHKTYGMSPVEQIALTINIALRREAATLDYYQAGSVPDAFGTVPKEWTSDQMRDFQDYFDAKMAGNLHRRRMLKFMHADFKLIEYRQPPLKDQYDEWLARVICYAFSVPATPFVSQVNRATSETMRLQATQEGLLPLKTWVKTVLDRVIQECMGEPDLEFAWVGDDAIDPLQQAQTLNILVSAGIKTREEARAELGLGGDKAATGLGKFNPYHDGRGRFTTADGAGALLSLVADETKHTPAGYGLSPKIQRAMARRGWTAQQIDEAVRRGNRIDAINKKTGGPATRYVNPQSGQSVVVDNTTNDVIHVGEEDFEYSPDSGDVPGALMRSPPPAESSTGETSLAPAATPGTTRVAPVEAATPVEPIVPIEPVAPIIPIEPLP